MWSVAGSHCDDHLFAIDNNVATHDLHADRAYRQCDFLQQPFNVWSEEPFNLSIYSTYCLNLQLGSIKVHIIRLVAQK